MAAYPDFTHAVTHPLRLAALARLNGLEAPWAAAPRVLDLGCASGANLLPMADALPGLTGLGIDLDAVAVGRGRALAHACGLADRVALRVQDFSDLGDDGPFDLILAHGFYGWVPPAVRAGLFARCRDLLADDGVLYVSFDTVPGTLARWVMRGLRPADAADTRRVADDLRALLPEGALAGLLAPELEHVARAADGYLDGDHAVAWARPFPVAEVVEHAAASGLHYVGEAGGFCARVAWAHPEVRRCAARTDDPVRIEALIDLVRGRGHRHALFSPKQPVRRAMPDQLAGLLACTDLEPVARDGDIVRFSSRWARSATVRGPVADLLIRLGDAWPAALPVAEIGAGIELLVLSGSGAVDLVAPPGFPLVRDVGEHPVASPIARAQAALGWPRVASRTHRCPEIDATDRVLLHLLDGHHDLASLAAAVGPRATAAVAELARNGVLIG